MCIGWRNVLNGLSTVACDIDANDGLFEIRIRRTYDCVVGMLLVFERIETFHHEFEQSDQILWMRRRHVNVHISKGDGGSDRQAHGSRFTTTTSGCQ